MKNYYDILGVDYNATLEEIKRAYREKCKETHPDITHVNNQLFSDINEAYRVLCDNLKNNIDYKKSFMNFVNGRASNNDIIVDVYITLKEAIQGVKKTVDISYHQQCDACNGNKDIDLTGNIMCPKCHGTGYIYNKINTHLGPINQITKCDKCSHGIYMSQICRKCNSTGIIQSHKTVEITIPPCVTDKRLLDTGYTNYPDGSVLVNINILPDSQYSIEGNRIYGYYDIYFIDALLGGTFTIKSIDNKSYSVKLPTCSKNKDEVYINTLSDGREYWIILNIDFPNELTLGQREMLLNFDNA